MSMFNAETVLCELGRGREYHRDPIVRAYVDAWAFGTLPADRALLELVQALSRTNARLIDAAVLNVNLGPSALLIPHERATPIRGVPPADAPGGRRCVPLAEALPDDAVYVTASGELVAQPRPR